VRPRVFGEGVVVACKITRLDEEVTVMLETAGLKHLAGNMANLEALN